MQSFENYDLLYGEADTTVYVYNKCEKLKAFFKQLPSVTLT